MPPDYFFRYESKILNALRKRMDAESRETSKDSFSFQSVFFSPACIPELMVIDLQSPGSHQWFCGAFYKQFRGQLVLLQPIHSWAQRNTDNKRTINQSGL